MIKNYLTNIKGVSHYRIVFNGSANIEPAGYKGISHLIEHCMCEKIKDFDNIFKEKSISWNACTSSTEVWFYISGISKYIRKFIKDYTNSILNYQITKDVFERERNIVITEYFQSYSSQTEAFILNYNRKHFNECGSIGFIDDLKNLTYENFIEYKNKVFSIPSDIIYIHHKSEKDLTENDLGITNLKFNEYKLFQNPAIYGNYNTYPFETYSTYNNQRIIVLNTYMPLEENYKNLIYAKIFKSCILGGLTSPLYQELREKLQCVYSIVGSTSKLDNNTLDFLIIVNTTEKEKFLVKNKLIEIISNIKKFINKKIFKNNVSMFKNAYKLANSLNWDRVYAEEDLACKNFILSNKANYFEFIEFINKFLNSNLQYVIDDEYINLGK